MAKLFPRDPWLELQTMKEDMNRLIEESSCPSPFQAGSSRMVQFRPVADVIETAEEFLLLIEIPGLSREEVALEIAENELVVFGERRMIDISGGAFEILERAYGCFARRFSFSLPIDAQEVRATMKEGLLSVVVLKRSSETANKCVSIVVED